MSEHARVDSVWVTGSMSKQDAERNWKPQKSLFSSQADEWEDSYLIQKHCIQFSHVPVSLELLSTIKIATRAILWGPQSAFLFPCAWDFWLLVEGSISKQPPGLGLMWARRISTQHTLLQQKISFGSVFSFQSRNEGEVLGELPNHYR